MQNTKTPLSNNDKIVGWIFTSIGILGILYAIQVSYSLHSERPDYTIGLMMGGIGIRSLIPLLFIASGQYYLSGKNAAKKAKKLQAPVVTSQIQGVETVPHTDAMPDINQPTNPGTTGELIVPTVPSNPQSPSNEQTPYTKE